MTFSDKVSFKMDFKNAFWYNMAAVIEFLEVKAIFEISLQNFLTKLTN